MNVRKTPTNSFWHAGDIVLIVIVLATMDGITTLYSWLDYEQARTRVTNYLKEACFGIVYVLVIWENAWHGWGCPCGFRMWKPGW
jgi:hypothetical protein